MSSSCCPAGSEKYLLSTYVPVGQVITIEGGVEAYISGTPDQKAMILFPDIYGWNGGNIRKIADMYAADGYYTIIPKMLSPVLEGGTDGDGIGPEFDLDNRMGDLGPWMALFPWTHFRPKIQLVIDHLKAADIKKAACIGFCWGGWMAAHTLIESDWDIVLCGASPHPSMSVEAWLFNTPNGDLPSRITKPFLLLPAGNDPDVYRRGGEIYEALTKSSPGSQVLDQFPEMKHGWVTRGDMTIPETARDVHLALTIIADFCKKNLA
mmetsp:Transcript_12751/g.12408  ORF Transcript_12751/g.12408 Transcript_12751/m.12408 type:complete len:265 (+) Transcript_12751:63-857(+)|eukprot:CAMPEP_0119034178 /NCGR_PEP_ID=MMETSP1177-20130426/1197_1 /TAXON_ID=2985 /ORGANISM="Ochromonas sp, Strain CCMP1899" /LENGTH=264 /DNA_ID=CAMNT_0006991443 /DNA_START=40 /DNA_END=834 /DNA_ORIENTATION=+